MAKLAVLMLVVLLVAAACSSGSKSDDVAALTATTGAAPAGNQQADGTPAATVESGDASVSADATSEAAFEQATGDLFLEMTSPTSDEIYVAQSSYEFSGRTTVDALLSVNDYVLEVDEEGRFAFSLDLEEGPNVVEVIASNSLGDQFDEVLLVFYEPA